MSKMSLPVLEKRLTSGIRDVLLLVYNDASMGLRPIYPVSVDEGGIPSKCHNMYIILPYLTVSTLEQHHCFYTVQ